MKIKETIAVVQRKGIFYQLGNDNNIKSFTPWLGDIFSFLYDRIMEKSVFPKKFQCSINRHYEILIQETAKIQNKNILEFACGSGDAVKFLNNDNTYTGIDISKGLLKIANRRFIQSEFLSSEFYVADACDLPFQDDSFNVGICNLSLNFFPNIDLFISELKRVLTKDGLFYCSVPVPEKKSKKVTIHGNLYSEEELKTKFQEQGFDFEKLPYDNGALIYFNAKFTNNLGPIFIL